MNKSILEHFVVTPGMVVEPIRDKDDKRFVVPDDVKVILPPRISEREVTFPLFFDNSMLDVYSLCDYKGYLRFGRGLAPSGLNKDLHFGGAMAKGLEVCRKSYYGDGHTAAAAIEDGLCAIWRTYGDYQNPDPRSPKTVDRLEAAFVAYFEEYPLDKDFLQPYRMADGQPAVEFTFAVPIPGTEHPETGEPILYVGRFDMLALYKSPDAQGMLIVDDEKTMTSSGPTWRERWDLDPQMSGYIWASRTFNYPVGGAMVRGIVILKGDIRFEQKLTMRAPWQIDQWLTATQRKINRIIDCWRAGVWPQALNAVCHMYGGCDFRKLCLSQDPEQWIPGNYITRIWNPLAKED